MNTFLLPPPNTFPLSTIYIAGFFTSQFFPLYAHYPSHTWDNVTKCLGPTGFINVGAVGSVIHVWKGAPWGPNDGWGTVAAIGAPCGAGVAYVPDLDIPTGDTYAGTYSLSSHYTINEIWDQIRAQVGLTVPGAIRWGKLWLKVITTNLTHSTTVMHFAGPPH